VSNWDDLPVGDPQAIAAILATGYLRYKRRLLQQIPLDSAAEQSRHVREVNETEKGETTGTSSSETD